MGKKSIIKFQAFFTFLVILIIVYSFSFIVGSFHPGAWYKNLKKPSFSPTESIFSFSRYSLFFLVALAASVIWNKKTERPHIALLFGTNLLLFFLWTLFFFGMHQLTISFFVLILLAISTISLEIYLYQIKKITSIILFPYLIGVLFLSYLLYQIVFII